MPDDLKKMQEVMQALPSEEKARLIRKLVKVLKSELGITDESSKVAEGRGSYQMADIQAYEEELKAIVNFLSPFQEATEEKGGNMDQFDRITQQPGMMGGKACIRGMRVTVSMIVSQIAAGASVDELLLDYPYLERDDIMQALRYAAWRVDDREVVLSPT